MTGLRPAIALGFGLLALLLGGAAQAQEDLSAGKTPEQLFQTNCVMCHKSPRGLAAAGAKAGGLLGGLENFLAQHYTSTGRSADIIAGYLKSVDSGTPQTRTRHAPRRTAKPKKPDSKSEKTTDEKSAPKTGTSAKPAMSEPKPEKKKPVSSSSQAKREKPKAADKKTD